MEVVHEEDEKNEKIDLKKPIIVVDSEVKVVCEILKYMLGEYQNDGKVSYCNEYKTCEDWEIDEIMRQVSDTNLGDFIIKCPNPDNVSQELQDIYGEINEDNPPFQLNASQAMEFFYDLFDMETAQKLDAEHEHVAFLIAFYFLKFTNTIE